MNSDLIRIAVIGAVAVALYYVVTQNLPIQNEGELNVQPGSPTDNYGLPSYRQDSLDLPNRPDLSTRYAVEPPAVAPGIRQVMTPESQVYDYQPATEPIKAAQLNAVKANSNVLPYPQISNNYNPSNADISGQFQIKSGTQPVLDCYPKDTVTPQELMPREDGYNTWSQVNPTVSGHLSDRNYLESSYSFGIDTVGSSLRNANLQLRSDPAIPMVQVGPWQQSTITGDTNHRQFEIGGDY